MLRLTNGWIVIKDLSPDEVKIGNIYIPEGSVETPYKWAEVLEVGKGRPLSKAAGYEEMEVAVGDRVIYVRFLKKTDTGKALTPVLEREYGSGAFLIQEKDVICVEPAQR